MGSDRRKHAKVVGLGIVTGTAVSGSANWQFAILVDRVYPDCIDIGASLESMNIKNGKKNAFAFASAKFRLV